MPADPNQNLKRTPANEALPQGWDYEFQQWRALAVDPIGQLLLSTPSIPVGNAIKTHSDGQGVLDLADAPASARRAYLFLEDASVRFWLTGASPTVSEGNLVYPGAFIELESRHEINGFRMVTLSGTAKISANYFGVPQP